MIESITKIGPHGAVANAKLIDHSANFEKRIIEITDGVYQVMGVGLANTTMIEGKSGMIIVDTGLHGFPDSSYLWRYQIQPLVEAGYRVIAPDLRHLQPFFHKSSINLSPYRLATLVEGLAWASINGKNRGIFSCFRQNICQSSVASKGSGTHARYLE